ncbi:MAG: four helix bundle protein [Verrucomicrobiales bacterium]|jgi:four helix bundle protein|nr:four helix bundle protein [Verrucomicrobiales bacterium]
MAYQSFEQLHVLQRAIQLAEYVYRSVESMKRFSLKDQMERSSLSIPSNIAEGQERDAPKDFRRFLRIAKGSSGELRTQSLLSKRLGLLSEEAAEHIVNETREISAMIQGLIRSIDSKLGAKTSN